MATMVISVGCECGTVRADDIDAMGYRGHTSAYRCVRLPFPSLYDITVSVPRSHMHEPAAR